MKTPPKSPQSSPVKRAKRARMMWVVESGVGIAACVESERLAKAVLKSMRHETMYSIRPVYLLPASEAAHEQRVAQFKAAFRREFLCFTMPENEAILDRGARQILASVYSAPAGKGRAK